MENTYKPSVIIIGLGNIGMAYDLDSKKILTHAKSFEKSKNFKLIGGVDFKKKLRISFEENYKCKTFKKIKDAMNELNPDRVVISTSSSEHFKNIKEVFKYRTPKVIVCEKPLALNLRDSEKIVEICKRNSSFLYVNYFRRVEPGFLKIFSLLKNNKIKTPFQGCCFYSKGIYNTASHFINILEFYFGRVKKIDIIKRNKTLSDPYPDFKLQFKDGDIIFISNKNKTLFLNNIDLIMNNGKLTFENGGSKILWKPIKKDNRFIGYKILETDFKVIKNDYDNLQLHFVEQLYLALKKDKVTLCSGEDALKTEKVLNQIKSKNEQ